jgi:hypothetical protein
MFLPWNGYCPREQFPQEPESQRSTAMTAALEALRHPKIGVFL